MNQQQTILFLHKPTASIPWLRHQVGRMTTRLSIEPRYTNESPPKFLGFKAGENVAVFHLLGWGATAHEAGAMAARSQIYGAPPDPNLVEVKPARKRLAHGAKKGMTEAQKLARQAAAAKLRRQSEKKPAERIVV